MKSVQRIVDEQAALWDASEAIADEGSDDFELELATALSLSAAEIITQTESSTATRCLRKRPKLDTPSSPPSSPDPYGPISAKEKATLHIITGLQNKVKRLQGRVRELQRVPSLRNNPISIKQHQRPSGEKLAVEEHERVPRCYEVCKREMMNRKTDSTLISFCTPAIDEHCQERCT